MDELAFDEADVLDRRALNNIRAVQKQGGPDLVGRIIGIFLDEAPAQIEALRKAVAADDPAGIAKTAHALKSGSANLGALRLAALCKALETLGRSGTTEGASDLLASVRTQFERAAWILAKERNVNAA